jgi:hypothetical protein
MANLRPRDMTILDNALSMHQGHVLNFSDRTFAEFFDAELGVDIDHSRYHKFGSSKARRLRCFVQIEKEPLVAKALRALWEHREYHDCIDSHSHRASYRTWRSFFRAAADAVLAVDFENRPTDIDSR